MKFKINPIYGKFDLVCDEKGNLQVTYTNLTPTPEDVGGIEKGSTFDHVPLPEMWDKLLYGDRKPIITLALNSDVPLVNEIGNNLSNVKFIATTIKTTADIQLVELLQNGEVVATIAQPKPNGGAEEFTLSKLSVNSEITARITDVNGKVGLSNAITFVFGRRFYYGVLPDGAVTEKKILSLNSEIATSAEAIYDLNFGQFKEKRLTVAVYGVIQEIENSSEYEIINSFDVSQVDVTCADKSKLNYYVYSSNICNMQYEDYVCRTTLKFK